MNFDPVFILGNRRSGTTMLRLMLASHPNIGIPPEGGFVVRMGWIWGRKRLAKADYPKLIREFFLENNSKDWEISFDQLERAINRRKPETFSQFADEVYRTYIRLKFPGKNRWGDKTTWYLDYLADVDRYFPNAKYIHIVRDGRGVVASFQKVKHLTSNIKSASLEWTWSVERIQQFGQSIDPGRYIETRYEDIVGNPEKELRRLCVFLNEDYSPDMLSFHKNNKNRKLEPTRHIRWKELTLSPATTERINVWKQELSNDDLLIFWTLCGETMERCKYSLIIPDTPVTKSARLGIEKDAYYIKRIIWAVYRPTRRQIALPIQKITSRSRAIGR